MASFSSLGSSSSLPCVHVCLVYVNTIWTSVCSWITHDRYKIKAINVSWPGSLAIVRQLNFNYIPLTCLFVFVFLWNQNRSIFPGKLPFVIKTRQDCRPQSPFWTPFGSLFIFSLPTPDPVPRSRVPSPSLVCDEKTVCTVGYASVIMISWSFQ